MTICDTNLVDSMRNEGSHQVIFQAK